MATLPTPNDLTRQQLDELDALLQRMLSLPLHKSESAKVPPAAPPPLPEVPASASRPSVSLWRADSAPTPKAPYIAAEPEPAVAFAPSFTAVAAPTEAIARPHFHTAPTPAVDFVPSGGPGTLRGVDAPALPYGHRGAFDPHDAESASSAAVPSAYGRFDLADVNPFADPPAAAQSPPAPAPTVGVPLLAWPVVALNWLIEAALAWMGPLGAIARTPALKHLLGFAGILLLVGAGLWSAKGMGWIHWPR